MLSFTTQMLVAFVLVLARLGGVLALAPLPGWRLVPPMAKVTAALLLALLFAPLARLPASAPPGPATMAVWVLLEATFGVAVGVALLLLTEMMGLGAQLLGFQAGYSYINTVDPSSQVDATVLNVLLTLAGGLLLFAFDIHLMILRALATSFRLIPLGEFRLAPEPALALARLGGAVFETAVRLSFPVVGLLLVLDVALALLSYVNARLQLLTLSFPVKMAVTMLVLSVTISAAPRLFQQLAVKTFEVVEALAGHGSGL